MRIKIIGENNCARATRHLLRLAGFAVTEFLPADAVVGGPHAGYAITIDLAPATHSPDSHLRPDPPTHDSHTSGHGEAARAHRDASSPSVAEPTAGEPACGEIAAGEPACAEASDGGTLFAKSSASVPAVAPAQFRSVGGIHFDSVESALEAAVLRHVAQLAAAPVVVDRPGGVVRSERELRIVLPSTGDVAADEAAAVAVEFGVLRGLLDLSSLGCAGPTAGKFGNARNSTGSPVVDTAHFWSVGRWKKWWPFGLVLIFAGLGILRAGEAAVAERSVEGFTKGYGVRSEPIEMTAVAGVMETHRLKSVLLDAVAAGVMEPHRLKPVLLRTAGVARLMEPHRLKSVLLEGEPGQGQFATGQEIRISDGTNFLVVDPCKGQTKFFASISQTGNTQLVAGTASRKIYVCSIHVVAAAATNVAVVEGTGSVCGTGTAGVNGFGGATAATGWNFAANGGIALGNGDSSLGAEGTSGDNLCVYSSGSGQVSGGISYVVQ